MDNPVVQSTLSRAGDVALELLCAAVIAGLIAVVGAYALDWLLQVRR